MTTTAPARSDSPTNLRHEEVSWRSAVCRVPSSHVAVDVTGATVRHEAAFGVRCLMLLDIRQRAEGLWVDFVGQAVDSLSVDGQPVPVAWDGARIDLPVLAPGEHTVEIAARGLYSNSGQGLHRFHDPVDGATYLYTHFEPSDARRAWPVMEQPDIKTRFSLEVTHPRGWTVMSNTRPQADASSRPAPTGTDSGCEVTSFAASAPLPSYLTALTAGPWHRVTGQWTSPSRPGLTIPLSWSCRASLAEHLDATELLDLTRAGLDLYDRAYDYGFPWDSYDSVLVPEYNLGAMENPGCVTFNEDLYLFRGPVTRSQRAGRANTILHEMCHMWFGDLVTPTWWEDTWLKESFADHQGTWAEAEAAGYTEAWVSFASTRKAWAYLEDSRPATTHPIVAQVDDVEAARQAFDGITYAKGAAVLKQLVAHVGQDTFLKAAGLLFERRAYGNASLDDFLRVLSQVSGRDMHDWARAWLHTAGPSVITDELAVQEGRLVSLTLRQEGTDPVTGQSVLRPHTLVVGLYSFDGDGALVRTHRLPVALETESVDVAEAVGLPAPDLVVVNDEDLTYAVVRPDDASLACLTTSLSSLRDPMARSLAWSMLHNLVRDAVIDAALFVQSVLAHADDDTEPSTLTALLNQALRVACRYADPHMRRALLERLLADDSTESSKEKEPAVLYGGWGRLRAAAPGSDAQIVRARAWLEAAGQARLLGEARSTQMAARVREILSGALPGLELDADMRWRAMTALARLDAVSTDELDAERKGDPTASGITHHLRASTSMPRQDLKAEVFDRLLTETALSNEHIDALVAGFGVDAHRDLTAAFTSRYLQELQGLWSGHGQEIATRLVVGLFPACGDESDAQSVEDWLAKHPEAPSALRRLILKSLDDLRRALTARRTGSADL
ncbi:aminopeptidase N [Actinomyces sp. oral taxon 171]|uniref:aminopeptidase N n=1 Tax=Actinomyces sp. oral taxon 171 TaxID=706438 RepID=UPI00031CD2AE|nr:aminopeptidase N [Actinomyces sp. oral taxon 171]QCT33174.1 aminopeptidase N [Actinomyces sp. oral taxon 171 str. F0337]